MRAPRFVIGLQLVVAGFFFTSPVVSYPAVADDGWGAEALNAAREQLTDLLASEQIDRLDFRARTFDEAIGLIATTVGVALERSRPEFATAEEATRYLTTVIVVFDTHKPRGLGLTFPSTLEHAINDEVTAIELGKVLGLSAAMVRQYVGPGATAERITKVSTNLLRHTYLEPMEGQTYLEQYLDEIVSIAALPPLKRRPFLDK